MKTNEEIKQEMMPYLEKMWREDYMDNEEWIEILDCTISKVGSWDDFIESIRIGEKNGYTVEKQIGIFIALNGMIE